jgi:transposase-like protein
MLYWYPEKELDMARRKFTTEEIIQHLRTVEIEQAKGATFEEAANKTGVTSVTISRWKKEYGGLKIDQAKRLKDLEQENSRLKKLVADLSIDNQILKEVSKGNF